MRSLIRPLAPLALLLWGACSHELEDAKPRLSSVAPTLVCGEQLTTSVELTGTGFSPLPTKVLTSKPELVLPAVHLQRVQDIAGAPATDPRVTIPDDPAAPQPMPHVRWQSQTSMSFEVYPELKLATGLYDVTVQNAPPGGPSSPLPMALTIVPPPRLDSIEPELVCGDAANSLKLTGDFFIKVGGALPTVAFGPPMGGLLPTLMASAAGGCRALPGPAMAEACTSLTVSLKPGALPAARYMVTVTNPAPAACTSSPPIPFFVLPKPTLTEIKPAEICTAQFDNVVVATGTGFLKIGGMLPAIKVGAMTFTPTMAGGCTPYVGPKTAVEVCTSLTFGVPKGALPPGFYDVVITNPAPAGCSTSEPVKLEVAPPPTITSIAPAKICEGGGEITITGTGFRMGATVTAGGVSASVTFKSATELLATFGVGLSAGTYDVTVKNPDGCLATASTKLTVVPGPIVFSVDPPVVWNGVAVKLTIWGSGLTGKPTNVWVQPAGMPMARIELADVVWDPAKPHRIQATLPKGLPAGFWDVIVRDPSSCDAALPMGLKIVDMTTLMITKVDPSFGSEGSDTAVTIYADDTVGGGFKAVPRAYLSPAVPGATPAEALRGVAFIDAKRLTGVVPKGLAPGQYTVIVVNPDGGVGTKAMAFTVTPDTAPPPVIDNITPGSINTSYTGQVTLTGSGFRAGATVDLFCALIGSGAAPTKYTAAVGALSATSLAMTPPSASIPSGSACLIRVTNTDGTYGEYSSLGVTNPADNLSAFKKGKDMNVARRALASVAGRATSAARFVYAIGGDSGAVSGALDSVEFAPVDALGSMGDWVLGRAKLPGALTLSGAAIVGRLVYVVGGDTGSGASGKAYRAEILDPAKVPGFDDLDIVKGGGTGLGKGTWVYRVAAVMGGSDPTNPGGETLPSEPIVVQLPDFAGKLKVTVKWTAVAGAAAYRVYRSVMADSALGTEKQVGPDVTGTSFEDAGAAATGLGPLPVGSTGAWVDLGKDLGAAREGAGIALAPHPTTAGQYYLYAMGGKSGGTMLKTIEYLSIKADGPADHTVGTWQTAGTQLGNGRWQIGAYVASPQNSSNVPAGTAWVYAGPGLGMGSMVVRDIDAMTVGASGDLGSKVTLAKDFSAAGYGAVIANNYLFEFGGAMGSPSTSSASGYICEVPPTTGGCTGPGPEVKNWNSLGGIDFMPGRYLMGSAVESAFIFILGGETDVPEPASKSTLLTVW